VMEEKGDKKERILEAATAVFSRKGYHLARVEEIADLAEVGKGTVYEYFSSKLELFHQTFARLLNRYVERVTGVDRSLTVKERIAKIFEAHVCFLAENKDFALVTYSDFGGLDQELLRWMYEKRKEKIKVLTEMLEEGVRNGEFRALDTELTANALMGMMRGVVVPFIMEGREDSPLEAARQAADIFFSGVLSEEAKKTGRLKQE